jgi:predicted amidophosphoribosyltransferase
MSEQKTKNKLCSRCQQYHKYIFEVWNNESGKKELLCRKCLAELIGFTDANIIGVINWYIKDLFEIYKKYKRRDIIEKQFNEKSLTGE